MTPEERKTAMAEVIGLCSCGHSIGGEHNSLGCYATMDYGLRTQRACDCKGTDDQDGTDALAPLVEEWIAKESKVAARVAQEGVVARVEAVLAECDRRIDRAPSRVLQFWVGRLRAALATEEPTP